MKILLTGCLTFIIPEDMLMMLQDGRAPACKMQIRFLLHFYPLHEQYILTICDLLLFSHTPLRLAQAIEPRFHSLA